MHPTSARQQPRRHLRSNRLLKLCTITCSVIDGLLQLRGQRGFLCGGVRERFRELLLDQPQLSILIVPLPVCFQRTIVKQRNLQHSTARVTVTAAFGGFIVATVPTPLTCFRSVTDDSSAWELNFSC